jgi:hypothetical protein
MIVILNGSTYFGNYMISLPHDCKVRRHEVICNTNDRRYPGIVAFTKQGPPRKVWFDGENAVFIFGNKVQASKSE